MRQRGGCFTLIILLAVMAGFIVMVWSNAQSGEPLRLIIPTNPEPTAIANAWQDILKQGFDGQGNPVPTVPVPDQVYVAPTLERQDAPTTTPVNAGQVAGVSVDVFSIPSTPTPPAPTSTIPPVGDIVVTRDLQRDPARPTSLPVLNPPVSHHPNDHFWFYRPIDSFGVNSINYYDYGTDGPKDAPLPIHYGVDLPNAMGTTIRAAAAGTVIFATSQNEEGKDIIYQNSGSYGRVVVIEHDFGYRGQRLFTLYAHLLEPIVKTGDYVQAGDPIALVGNTGHATGWHVHFEVMIGQNTYGSTYNPALWMVPYVGHGIVAGRVVDSRGQYLQDVDVTLTSGGLVRDTTTTYVFRDVGSKVNPDPAWQENFVFSDVPRGNYEVNVTLNGKRVTRFVEVREGITSFVEFQADEIIPLPPTATTEDGS